MSRTGAGVTDWKRAVLVGLVAWVAGLVLTLVLGRMDVNTPLSIVLEISPIGGSVLMHLAFHSWFVTGPADYVSNGLPVFSLLPVFLLLAAGVFKAWLAGVENVGEGAVDGASTTAGYLIGAILSFALIITLATLAGVPVPLSLTTVVDLFLAGIAFPVVFAGVGGAVVGGLAVLFRTSEAASASRTD